MFLRRTFSLLTLTHLLLLQKATPPPTAAAQNIVGYNLSLADTFQQILQPFHNLGSPHAPSNMTRAPAIAISHGGGPMPILGDPAHEEIVKSLKERVPRLLKLGTPEQPKAIVLVTAHWSERVPTISNGKKHKLYYDYYGFPKESYSLKYDAPGSPEVAEKVKRKFQEAGLSARMDEDRGWDHGVFIPMLLINPKADIPIVQLSVLDSESPSDHYRMGQALSFLRDENIAIIGSGFASLHNLRLMFSGAFSSPSFKTKNDAWSRDVTNGVTEKDPELRAKKLEDWRKWTGAYDMHPRGGAEHFLPLIVVAGAGGDGEGKSYKDKYMGLNMYTYYWE